MSSVRIAVAIMGVCGASLAFASDHKPIVDVSNNKVALNAEAFSRLNLMSGPSATDNRLRNHATQPGGLEAQPANIAASALSAAPTDNALKRGLLNSGGSAKVLQTSDNSNVLRSGSLLNSLRSNDQHQPIR